VVFVAPVLGDEPVDYPYQPPPTTTNHSLVSLLVEALKQAIVPDNL
jgi:hypothetical protein